MKRVNLSVCQLGCDNGHFPENRAPKQGDPAARRVSGYRSLRNLFHLEKILQTNRENPNSCGGKVIKE